ncbi:acyl-coenzyme A synthetase/AMP-(fatty) acid ligase [Saccharopolyspora phatthalungensis]|uniref:Acyl-coenzyme A synthetase/AMP-(Fatty) acid ligase n=1 Tax=Saccharopolyspora phatthalungensis TaxID=664693 RepID=A0A840QL01_9PSEU|nr:acyl-coenzyme A synthetase/AMP-(fatty) acid ligase [Saccharopolyspora phatthalungensis]
MTFDELRYPINHSEAPLLVADDPLASTVLPHIDQCPGLEHVVVHEPSVPVAVPVSKLSELAGAEPKPFEHIDGHEEQSPALILYTSGSTGRPKGVVLNAGAFGSSGAGFAECFGITASDNYFLPLTMAHAIGALVGPAMAVVTGGSLTLVDRFSPTSFWRQVAETGATYSILFPAHLNLLMETQEDGPSAGESSLRLVITHAWLENFYRRFNVNLATVWGMTETGAMATGSAPGHQPEGYVGKPMSGVEVGIFDEMSQRLPAGEVGEIRLRHRNVMLEYFKNPEATGTTLVDGWVRSGDYGFVDADGGLYFGGRLQDMIKRSGENISPEEVINALVDHPDVTEAFVMGVPDPIRTEEVAALVVIQRRVDLSDVIEVASQRLIRRKLPRYIIATRDPLPRLGNGKIDRATIKRDFDPANAWDRIAE